MGIMTEGDDRTRQNEVIRELRQQIPEHKRDLEPILPWGKLTNVQRVYVLAAGLDTLVPTLTKLLADLDDGWLKEEGKDPEGFSAGYEMFMVKEGLVQSSFTLRLLAAEMEGTPRESVPYGRQGYPMVIPQPPEDL